ncbi:MAG TPA: PA14 domain-containing protein [Phycisphaerae bacterium]|nr:PA14 domain-containing protein [Phycisphaerae bacterium]HRY67483.1 PA14 domain-containing protein [Phycisphaerae bacterium]HSA27924.1 PA14 domain-containing protein [Phycisphaerae bacterium]
MSLRLDFAGILTAWQGAALGLGAALLAWHWYRRDLQTQARGWVRLLLPLIRAFTVFAVVVCLTGPVLTHRWQEGQLGRVLVFVDGSQSMGLNDEHLDTGRKLLIAASRGDASTDRIDLGLLDMGRLLSEARQIAMGRGGPLMSLGREERLKRLQAQLEKAAGQLAGLDTSHLPPLDAPRGSVTVEYFEGVPGAKLDDLTGSPKFKQAPDQKESRDLFESRPNRGDNYGTRVRGFICPPLGGAYTFRINSDDDSMLSLSPDRDHSRKKTIARVDGFTPYHQWEVMPSQRSAPVRLEAGRSYYIEALHKEGSGEDFVCVGWDRPDGKKEWPIPGLFLSSWEQPGQDGASTLAGLRQEFDREILETVHRLPREPAANDRTADVSRLTQVADMLGRWEERFAAAFAAYADGVVKSGDPKLRKVLDEVSVQTRWKRAESLVLDTERGLVAQLSETHQVDIMTLAGSEARRVWDSSMPTRMPDVLPGTPDSRVTDLADGIRSSVGEGADRTAVVLLSDGRHNDGGSPLELARFLGVRGVPVHVVGLGSPFEPPDLALAEVQAPQSVYADDRVKGQIHLRDAMAPGRSFVVTISNRGREVWKQELQTDGSGVRRIDFDFAAKEATATRNAVVHADVQTLSEPVGLQVVVSPVDGECRRDNNSSELRFMVTRQGRRILLLDGRPRWETRYIRDLFDRDRQWRIDPLIQDVGAQGPTWSRVDGPGRFPPDRESLMAYGLIILGELPPGALRGEELEWIRDFVEKHGGGLVLIDGQRGHLREYERTVLGRLIPVGPADSFGRSLPDHLELAAPGRLSAALRLENDSGVNAALWPILPAPHWIAPVRALEGTEVLAEAVCRDERRVPFLVHRQVGAGHVLYCASDETWRWRYEVADRYQTRYWNQIVNWLMEAPFAVKDRFLALDAGGPAYQAGESARIRVQLSDREGKPLAGARGEAAIYRAGVRVAAIPLEPDTSRIGRYRAATPALDEGEYEVGVSIEGFSELETKARTTFAVETRQGAETARLSSDEELLRAMAATSGGTYLREEEVGRLAGLLKPLSAGRTVVSETRLAQSYWFFAPIILLLTLEWVVRKRVGLI